MILDDLESQNRDFYRFLAISNCETHFKSELLRMEKLRMKFSALIIDIDGPSIDFLGPRKTAHDDIKERPKKSLF